jgi:hypothetical protein
VPNPLDRSGVVENALDIPDLCQQSSAVPGGLAVRLVQDEAVALSARASSDCGTVR